jgi:hypothetical protein
VVAGEAAAVASFLDFFCGVALAAGVAAATDPDGVGLAAFLDLFFGVAEAAGVGVGVCEYASGDAAIAISARSESNLRIKQRLYLDSMLVGNPGSVKNVGFSLCGGCCRIRLPDNLAKLNLERSLQMRLW